MPPPSGQQLVHNKEVRWKMTSIVNTSKEGRKSAELQDAENLS